MYQKMIQEINQKRDQRLVKKVYQDMIQEINQKRHQILVKKVYQGMNQKKIQIMIQEIDQIKDQIIHNKLEKKTDLIIDKIYQIRKIKIPIINQKKQEILTKTKKYK